MPLPWLPRIEIIGEVSVSVYAAVFFGVGVLLLLFGWHIYRIALVALGVLVGGAVGALIANLAGFHFLYLAVPLGILGGVLTAFLDQVAAFFGGGACGAMLMIAIVQETAEPAWLLYVAAGLAFLIGGIVTAWLYKPMIIVSLSVVGALCIANAVTLVADVRSPGSARQFFYEHPYVMAGGVALVALGGIVLQSLGENEETEGKDKKKKKPATNGRRPGRRSAKTG